MNLTKRRLEEELEGNVTELSLNRPQLRIAIVLRVLSGMANVWPRGVGKSFMIAFLIRMIVRSMPGATWAIQGASFVQLLEFTLPDTLDALSRLGYHQGVNYVFGKGVPTGWIPPYRKVLQPKHALVFHGGYDKNGNQLPSICFQLLSQEGKTSGRGPSYAGIINDEGLTLNYEKYVKTTAAALRGNNDRYGKLPYHHAEYFFSSMPYGRAGEWMTKMGDYYLEEDNYNFRHLMNQVIDLQLDFLKEKDINTKLEIYQEIVKEQSKITFYPDKRTNFLYTEATGFENIAVVGIKYVQNAFDKAGDINLFLVEYLNKLIGQIEGKFYAALDPNVHAYNADYDMDLLNGLIEDSNDYRDIAAKAVNAYRDCVSSHPLELGLDFGKVNWVVVAQHFKGPNRLNFINSMYVKNPEIIDDLAKAFCKEYKNHKRKVVHVWPDGMGNDEVANAKMTFTQQFCGILKDNGWICIIKQKSKKNPEHHNKYLLWNRALLATIKKDNRIYPEVMFNRLRCKPLLFAMENTGTLDHGNNMIAKDKRPERKLPLSEREKAPDSTDAADQIMYGLYGHLVYSRVPRSSLIQQV